MLCEGKGGKGTEKRSVGGSGEFWRGRGGRHTPKALAVCIRWAQDVGWSVRRRLREKEKKENKEKTNHVAVARVTPAGCPHSHQRPSLTTGGKNVHSVKHERDQVLAQLAEQLEGGEDAVDVVHNVGEIDLCLFAREGGRRRESVRRVKGVGSVREEKSARFDLIERKKAFRGKARRTS
jgi:superfamily II DNA helicase RecQ